MTRGTINGMNKLPDKLYKVRVPLVATYSEFEIEHFGLPTTVNNGVKKDEFEETTIVMLKLDKIIDIFIDGYSISLLSKDDTEEIYRTLEDYITGVNNTMEYSINRSTPKDPRINDIDKFLSEMFGYNKPTIVRASLSGNSGFDLGMNKMSVGNVRRRSNTVSEPVGLMSAYSVGDDEPVVESNVTYIVENNPIIDMSKIKRTPITRQRRGMEKDK